MGGGKKKAVPRIRRPVQRHKEDSEIEILNASLPRFGPLHGTDQPLMAKAKDKSWKHVQARSMPEVDGSKTLKLYVDAVKGVEIKARATYVGVACESDDFVTMMITDGCFFLHLAFLILGYELGYEESDPIFGKQGWKKIHKWVDAMFFVGNQIPLVVLTELIKQNFFKDIIAKEKGKFLKMPPFGLCKVVLYQQLIEPVLEKLSPPKRTKKSIDRQQPCAQQESGDMLHALLIMLVGSTFGEGHKYEDESEDMEMDEYEIDLEANMDFCYDEDIEDEDVNDDDEVEDEDDNDADDDDDNDEEITNQEITMEHGNQNNIPTADGIIISLLEKIALKNEDSQNKRIYFPSADKLWLSGILMKKLRYGVIRKIRCTTMVFMAFLFVPALQIDYTTEKILHHLKTYENSQPMQKHERKISSYLQLMSDLIQTPEDVILLKKKGIIEEHFEFAEPEMFSRLSSSSDNQALSKEFRKAALNIETFSCKARKCRTVITVIIVQVIWLLLYYL